VRIIRCWRQWWIGDTIRNITPLHELEPVDYNHLDKIPLSEDEMHGRTGKDKDKRRASRKTFSELKTSMNYVHNKVVDHGAYRPEITPALVNAMFQDIAHLFTEEERDAQKHWVTVLKSVRKRIREENGEEDDYFFLTLVFVR
jgi:hypothetical protein